MGSEVKLCFFLLFTLVVFSSARNTISVSGNEIVLAAEERSLIVSIQDYNEPSANRGHDPPSSTRGGGSGRGRRKGRKG
ncbi:protein PSY3-like [Hibiscus syriacus]|uniref:protein PSY3-like n=1 Tax=Hibiscus syriacus TaxID=106335 RepID=UPI0019241A10|nr:protein PSY3-like [Hibiscus syriacus]